jgi:hypothetical protein
MLYVHRLELADEDGNVLYKVTNKKAEEALQKALSIVKAKEGKKSLNNIFLKFARDVDNELKDYFRI